MLTMWFVFGTFLMPTNHILLSKEIQSKRKKLGSRHFFQETQSDLDVSCLCWIEMRPKSKKRFQSKSKLLVVGSPTMSLLGFLFRPSFDD
jgi:hypothetical protein